VSSVILNVIVGAVCFYFGNTIGFHTGLEHARQYCAPELDLYKKKSESLNQEIYTLRQDMSIVNQAVKDKGLSEKDLQSARRKANKPRFPTETSRFVSGSMLIKRDDFASSFDMGVPLDKTTPQNSRVLLLYNQESAMPKNRTLLTQAKLAGEVPLAKSALEATENCDFLNVILTDFGPRRSQCIAIMGQYEAFHIQKFMRLPKEGKHAVSHEYPLRLVSRGLQANGRISTKVPQKKHSIEYWKTLSPYLANMENVLFRLEPIAKEAAGSSNTVIVMVCNHGQSELLLNFVCNCKARNLSFSNVLLFATDIETKDLAESLGMKAFYDEETFGAMPKEAARQYADPKFTKMMMAKIYCVQLLAMLDHDILFQDVDIVWFRNPLEIFHNENHPWYDFDIYFQDDGNHALYYAPYSANTGFYYVRQNERTQHFFNSLLMAGDMIVGTHSHQITLISVLNEHASMYGLKTKILSRLEDDFPGGYHFHNRKPYMREFINKKHNPYIFHMSW